MSKCTAKDLVSIYKSALENCEGVSSEDNWEVVAEKSGLTASTARQKIGAIRKALTAGFLAKAVTPEMSEEELAEAKDVAKSDANEILPFFPRTGGGRPGSTDISDIVSSLTEQYEADLASDESDDSSDESTEGGDIEAADAELVEA
jgi:hypothetical protein